MKPLKLMDSLRSKQTKQKDNHMITKLNELVAALSAEYTKFDGGNKSAGTRARKILQEIKAECQVVRVGIQEKKTDVK